MQEQSELPQASLAVGDEHNTIVSNVDDASTVVSDVDDIGSTLDPDEVPWIQVCPLTALYSSTNRLCFLFDSQDLRAFVYISCGPAFTVHVVACLYRKQTPCHPLKPALTMS